MVSRSLPASEFGSFGDRAILANRELPTLEELSTSCAALPRRFHASCLAKFR
jgi:hypothetical protein